MNNYVLILPQRCLTLESRTGLICLPEKQLCLDIPTDGFLVECGQAWNCTRCASDGIYHHPFFGGDKIQIQFPFFDSYNPNPENPINGFGPFVRVRFMGDVSGVLTDLSLFASRSMVAHGCGKSYQIIEIDTTLFPDCVWSLEVATYTPDGNQSQRICTQEFGRVSNCDDTIVVSSDYSGKDCFGNCYGEPDAYTGDLIQYDNTIRLYGYFKNEGGSFTKTISNGRKTSISLQETFTLQLGKKIPPYVKNILLKQILSGDVVYVDGEDYRVDSFTISNEIESGRMFLFAVEVFKECESTTGCN